MSWRPMRRRRWGPPCAEANGDGAALRRRCRSLDSSVVSGMLELARSLLCNLSGLSISVAVAVAMRLVDGPPCLMPCSSLSFTILAMGLIGRPSSSSTVVSILRS